MRWLYEFDMEGFKLLHVDLHRKWLDPFFFVLTGTGLGWVQFLLVIVLLRWKSTRYYVLPLLATLFVSGVVVADGVKLFVSRDRPSNLSIAVLQDETAFAKSFPSGHTTTAFGIAFMLFLLTRKKEHAWIGQVALGWALLVGISRVYRGLHWPTDVLAGMFGGMFAAALVYLVLGMLGHLTHLDTPDASLSGQEANSTG